MSFKKKSTVKKCYARHMILCEDFWKIKYLWIILAAQGYKQTPYLVSRHSDSPNSGIKKVW